MFKYQSKIPDFSNAAKMQSVILVITTIYLTSERPNFFPFRRQSGSVIFKVLPIL